MHTIFKSIVKKEYKKSTNILNISAKHLFLIIFCGAYGSKTYIFIHYRLLPNFCK